ncbi:DUF2474 family protein [Phaeobacter piscinae]|uniref:DUF2474 family protein n=1 Tax=Phaeobacter piscinae TaxID=1580596 RepID=UPI000BBE3D75
MQPPIRDCKHDGGRGMKKVSATLWKRLRWMTIIWILSVVVLVLVAGLLRLILSGNVER